MTLTPERWQRARDVLHEAMEMDEEERSAFLDSQCASDPSLRAELKELLAAEGKVGSKFLEEPALAAIRTETATSHTVLPSGTRLGPYIVVSLIGAGGMGEVYRARDASLKRDVAIKVLPESFSRDPDRLRRFQLEAEAAAALNHPNILSIFAIGQQDGSPYIVTELLEGETLRERLRRGALKLRDAIDIAIQTAKGLSAAHEKGIAHRDFKPENLFLCKDGRVKILDFGLAKLMQASSSSDGPTVSLRDQTDAGRVLGTVGYMSPEQVRGEPADTRGDIFALGCVLYEMLTGKRAFRKPTSVETMHAILSEDPQAASDITPSLPSAIERVVYRCLEKSPDRRFQSASDLAFALEALSDSAIGSSDADRTRKKGNAIRRTATGAVAGVVLMGVALFTYLWSRPELVPRVSNYVQLTHDGHPKTLVGTDGSRLYFNLGFFNVQGIGQISIAGGEPIKITTPTAATTATDISPDGSELLVIDKGGFWGLPILGGSPRRLGETSGQSAAWSPDGKTMAYAEGSNLFVANADGSKPRKVVTGEDFLMYPSWSPNGNHLRFDAWKTDTTRASLWEVSTTGSGLHPLFTGWHDPADECCGKWTADGKYFVFVSQDQIWVLARKGSFFHSQPRPIQLTTSPMLLRSPLPSKDGKKLYVVGRTYRGELVRYDATSGKLEPFLGGISAEFVDFSKDGQKVTYVRYPEGTLWRSKADGSEQAQLTYTPIYAMLPRLSPDGKNIVFYDLNAHPHAKLYVVPYDGGNPRQLLPDDLSYQMDPTWSPDGKKIAFGGNANDAASTIRILDLERRQVTTLSKSQGLFGSNWSPDGRYIIAQPADGSRLLLFDFQTQQWTHLMSDYSGWKNWSKNGKYVYVSSGGASGAVLRIRVSDLKIEQVADLKNVVTAGRYDSWLGLAPDDSPILLRDNGSQDIYAVDWEAP